MLDEYILGSAIRISQEAPVMVIRQNDSRAVPGGAANVAANIVAMGGTASIVGVIGQDPAGETLSAALKNSGVRSTTLLVDSTRPTTRKTRVLANHAHQVLRVDHESTHPIDELLESELFKAIRAAGHDADAILISDYRKGVITKNLVQKVIQFAKESGKFVIANAKPGSLSFYSGAHLVSVNQYEAIAALGETENLTSTSAEAAAQKLREMFAIENVIVTLGGSGMAGSNKTCNSHVPAVKVEVYDEAGAGDTVIATLALGACSRVGLDEAMRLATHTAAAVVRKVGVAVPDKNDLTAIETLT